MSNEAGAEEEYHEEGNNNNLKDELVDNGEVQMVNEEEDEPVEIQEEPHQSNVQEDEERE